HTQTVHAPATHLARDGFALHVHVVAGSARRAGFWVPATVADRLSIRPGDAVTVGVGGASERVPVAGVYEDLSATNIDRFWFPVIGSIIPKTPEQPTPPPPLLGDLGRFLALEARL